MSVTRARNMSDCICTTDWPAGFHMNACESRLESRKRFDLMIGQLDRLLSEFLVAADERGMDEADRQTIKHHADDLIGVGSAALKRLGV